MDEGTLEDLEIVAGQVWSAVGGVEDGAVEVRQVDPKRFGVEVAAATNVQWVAGEEGDVRTLTLSTLRPFKPMDMAIVENNEDSTGAIALVTGFTRIRNIEIGGVNQFTSVNEIPSAVFGTVLSAPRLKIRFDTVQTSPALSLSLENLGSVIAASDTLTAYAVFSGVAVKR